MRVLRSMWRCAVVATIVGVFAPIAAAQFGGGAAQTVEAQSQAESELFKAATPKQRTDSPPERPCLCVGESDETSSVAKIKLALSKPLKGTGLDFTEQPLEDIVNFLQEEYDIPIHVDVPALEDSGLTPDEPMSCNVQNVSLRSALRLLLKQKGLTWVIENEVLTITTPEVAETSLVTCVYDVRDLVNNPKSFEALVDAIISCIATGTWAENGGGEAEVRPIQPGLLVVSQMAVVHDEIAELLTAIRKMRHVSNAAGPYGDTEATSGEFGGAMMSGEFGMPATQGAEGGGAEPTPAE